MSVERLKYHLLPVYGFTHEGSVSRIACTGQYVCPFVLRWTVDESCHLMPQSQGLPTTAYPFLHLHQSPTASWNTPGGVMQGRCSRNSGSSYFRASIMPPYNGRFRLYACAIDRVGAVPNELTCYPEGASLTPERAIGAECAAGLHCPCGNHKVLAQGLCATCYTFKRQAEEHFGGLRE